MTKLVKQVVMTLAILLSALVLQPTYAGQPQGVRGNPDRFAVQLPAVDREELADLVRALRSQLILRKQELVQAVEDSQFEGNDAVLAAILPGGLLYAGYRKMRHENAMDELARVDAAIQEYSSDILAMQSEAGPVAVAQLR